MNVAGRRVLVTGASSGIGEATARALAASGASLCLVARRGSRLQRLAEELSSSGAVSLALPLDIARAGAAERAVRACVEGLGGLDILVNNAAQGLHASISEVKPADVRRLFEVNVIAQLLFMQAAARHMRARRDGLIVNVGSNAARMERPGVGPYAASKAALESLSAAARVELAPDGIRVLTVSPGRTVTELGHRAIGGKVGSHSPAGGLTPGGGPADSAEHVAGRIVAAIEAEVAVTAAPLGSESLRTQPIRWDRLS